MPAVAFSSPHKIAPTSQPGTCGASGASYMADAALVYKLTRWKRLSIHYKTHKKERTIIDISISETDLHISKYISLTFPVPRRLAGHAGGQATLCVSLCCVFHRAVCFAFAVCFIVLCVSHRVVCFMYCVFHDGHVSRIVPSPYSQNHAHQTIHANTHGRTNFEAHKLHNMFKQNE